MGWPWVVAVLVVVVASSISQTVRASIAEGRLVGWLASWVS